MEFLSKKSEDRLSYFKSVLSHLNDISDLKEFFDESAVDRLEISKNGIVFVMGNSRHGIKFALDDKDFGATAIGALCLGDYEAEETDMVMKILGLLPSDSVVFDVGANLGWYSLNIKKCFKDMTIHSFEPSPMTYKRLLYNFQLNNECSKNVYNIGFHKENGKLDFYYDRERSGAASLLNNQNKAIAEKISVDMIKMDDFVKEKEIAKVDFIKCDVEGAELFVFMGGGIFIRNNLPIVFSEMLRKWCAKFNYHPNDIINFFSDMGYGCFVIRPNSMLAECPAVTDNTVETNFFFLHKTKHIEIIKNLS